MQHESPKGFLGKITRLFAPNWPAMTMSDHAFWKIIGLFNWKEQGNDEAVIEPAVVALSQMNVENIKKFEDTLAEKLYALDTEAHARSIGEEAYRPGKYFSVDWFLYERCAVVANGRTFYNSVLTNAAQMPKDMEFEAILSVARSAYERKVGKEFDHVTPISYETFSNRKGWPHPEGDPSGPQM